MDTEHVILLAVLALLGAWALWQVCMWIGAKVADVVCGREPGGRK